MKYNERFWPLLPSGDALPPNKLLAPVVWVGQSGSFSSLWVLVGTFFFFPQIVSRKTLVGLKRTYETLLFFMRKEQHFGASPLQNTSALPPELVLFKLKG